MAWDEPPSTQQNEQTKQMKQICSIDLIKLRIHDNVFPIFIVLLLKIHVLISLQGVQKHGAHNN